MSYFKEIVGELESNYEKAVKYSDYNCIPFAGMSRLEKYLPGIEKESYTIITAATGIGKSKLARHLYVDTPMRYTKSTGKPVKIFFFSLEESKKKFFLSEMSKRLFTEHDITVSIKQLQSIGRHNIATSRIIDLMHKEEKYMTELLDKVQVIDYIKTPNTIAEYMYTYANRVGKFTYNVEEHKLPSKFVDRIEHIIDYKPHNPDLYTIFIVDHAKLMVSDSGQRSIKESIDKFSSVHCVNLRNICKFTPVLVQQQAAEKEKKQYNFKGFAVEDKNKPSLDGLGEHKLSAHDADIVLGLFAPNRYGYSTSNQYDITRLKDCYREMSILKNRNGLANLDVPLFFNGATSHFEELPSHLDSRMNRFYEMSRILNG